MRNPLFAVSIVFLALPAQAAPRPKGAESVKLTVVGYRSDGIDTSHTEGAELKTLKLSDIKSVSRPSSWYYAVETSKEAGGHTFLARDISVAVGEKTAKFTSADRDAPEGSASSLADAARRKVSGAKAMARKR